MNVSRFDSRRSISAGSLVLLVTAALTLAGCQTDSASPTAADAPKAEAAAAPKPDTAAAKPETAAPKPQAAAKPAEPADDGEPMTRARAARECWMRTEKGNQREDIDKRADLVNKCIDEKLKAAGAAAPKT